MKFDVEWDRTGQFTFKLGKRNERLSDGSCVKDGEWWIPLRAVVVEAAESDAPMPVVLEFYASHNANRKLHWLMVKELPDSVMKVASLTGRRMKNSDGVWQALSQSATGGKVR